MSHPLLDPAKGPQLDWWSDIVGSIPQAEIVGVKAVDTIEFTIVLRDLFQIGLSLDDIARKLLSRYVIQERVKR